VHFWSTAIDALQTPAPSDAVTRPEILFAPTARFKTLFHNRHAKYIKIGIISRQLTHRLSHRLAVDGNQCPSNSGTLCRRNTRSEIIFPLTASLKTLCHNRHAKYIKIGVFPRQLTYRMSHRLPVDGNRCTQSPAPSDAEQPDWKYYSLQPQATKHFAITATLNTQKSAFFHDSLPTVCLVDLRSTAIDAPQTPAPSDAEQPDRKYCSPLTASHKTLCHNRHEKYTQKHVIPRQITCGMSLRLAVDGNRCPSNTGTL
jgi:hypothetical protein